MYPTACMPHKFYGLPKIHKTGTPLRPFVSSRGSGTYRVAKVLSKLLKPLADKSPIMYKVQVTVNKAKKITLQLGECLISYDVTSLFTSDPIERALKIIRGLLEKGNRLQDRTVSSVQHIIDLMGFCMHNTYFRFTYFKMNSMSRLREWQWVHWSCPYLPICMWSILRGKPSGLPLIPQVLVWVCG